MFKNISTLYVRVLIFTFYSYFYNYFVTIRAIMIIVKRKERDDSHEHRKHIRLTVDLAG